MEVPCVGDELLSAQLEFICSGKCTAGNVHYALLPIKKKHDTHLT